VKGEFGSALEFDGAGAGVKISPGLVHEKFTTIVWVYSEGDWGVKRTEIWFGSQTYGYFVLLRGDERAAWKQSEGMLHWYDEAGWHAIGSGKLKAETWYHLAGGYDGKKLEFYLNGKLIGSEETKIANATKDMTIGCHPNPTNWFKGIIDDIAVFDRALTKEEINKIITFGLEQMNSVSSREKLGIRWGEIKN